MAPRRYLVNIVITDAGFANWQLSCGHIYWMWPKKRSYANELHQIEAKFKSGDRAVTMECPACQVGNTEFFPLGTPLPTSPPRLPWEEDPQWFEKGFEEDEPSWGVNDGNRRRS